MPSAHAAPQNHVLASAQPSKAHHDAMPNAQSARAQGSLAGVQVRRPGGSGSSTLPPPAGLSADPVESAAQTVQMSESLSAMNDTDRYGLAGLLHMIRNENSDIGAIAIGQDLTALGLDLNQPE